MRAAGYRPRPRMAAARAFLGGVALVVLVAASAYGSAGLGE